MGMDRDFPSLFSFDITPFAVPVKYRRGEAVFNIGDESSKLVYIAEGFSRCYYIFPDGETAELDYAPSPAFYGEMEMLGIQRYTSSVEAVTECTGYSIDLTKCRDLLLSDPVFLRNLAVYIASKLFRVNSVSASNMSLPLKRRLSSYILRMESGGIYTESHTSVSKYLSVSYRHLLHVFNELEKEGALERIGRGRYRVKDRRLLEEEGEGCMISGEV